jgi:hypothetical protein
MNVAMALGVPAGFELAGVHVGALDVVGLAAALAMSAGLAVRALATLRALAAREPAGRVHTAAPHRATRGGARLVRCRS